MLTNADTPEDAAVARANGAEGIGLVRSEHMFFGSDERLRAVRKMIMAGDKKTREEALAEILPFQRSDFEGIFKAMDGFPVTVRLLDPPLHEFLPEVSGCYSQQLGSVLCRGILENTTQVGHKTWYSVVGRFKKIVFTNICHAYCRGTSMRLPGKWLR